MQIFNIVEELEKERKKNKELEELCNKYEEEHNNAFKLWTMKMEEMPDYEERMNYKSRNEKAIEKIKKIQLNAYKYGAEHDVIVCEELLNILKGDNK